MSRSSGSGQGTRNHKDGCVCSVCKRVRGRADKATGEPKVGRFAPNPATPSIAEAHELASNPKALELAQKLAKVESDLAAKQSQYNAQGVLYSNVRTECESLKRELVEATRKTAELERSRVAQRDVLMERNTQINTLQGLLTNAEDSAKGWEQTAATRQSRIEDLEKRLLEAEAHAANLVEGNARLCNDLSWAEQGRDLATKERDDAIRHIEADDRANLLGTLGVAFIVGLVAWLVRGWLHA